MMLNFLLPSFSEILFCLEIGSHVAQADLELILWPRMTLNYFLLPVLFKSWDLKVAVGATIHSCCAGDGTRASCMLGRHCAN